MVLVLDLCSGSPCCDSFGFVCWPLCLSVLMHGAEASGVTGCGGCWMDRQVPATESARDVIALRAWVSSPLELRFRDVFRRL